MCGSGCCDLDPGSPSQPAETGSTTAAATASSTAAAAAAVASGTRLSFQDDRDARGGGATAAASAGSEARCENERRACCLPCRTGKAAVITFCNRAYRPCRGDAVSAHRRCGSRRDRLSGPTRSLPGRRQERRPARPGRPADRAPAPASKLRCPISHRRLRASDGPLGRGPRGTGGAGAARSPLKGLARGGK